MPLVEPAIKRAISFVDGQNLFYHAKDSFGYQFPNYDILKLAERVCGLRSWNLAQARFYTGVPDVTDNPFWNHFWTGKLASMGRQGIYVFSRRLRYRNKTVELPGLGKHTFLTGEEKGVDVRIALDVIGLANQTNTMSLLFLARIKTFQRLQTRCGLSADNRTDGSKLPVRTP